MMTELWLKTFLAGVVTTITAKLLGCKWNVFLLFAAASAGWMAAMVLLIAITGFLQERRKR